MLTDICAELNNYFDRDMPKSFGDFSIDSGVLQNADSYGLKVGQYYRIIGSVFNDGVHKWTGEPDEGLVDESFTGAIWLMAVPKELVVLSDEVDEWVEKYGKVAMTPFVSENLSASSYSYTKDTSAGGGNGATWQNIFAKRLSRWRKIRP